VIASTRSGVYEATVARSSSKPSVCFSMNSASMLLTEAVHESEVRSRARAQVKISVRGRQRASGIDHDQPGCAGRLARGEDAHEEDRALLGGVMTEQNDHVGLVEVGVAPRRAICAKVEHQRFAGCRGAQPRVGVDVWGRDPCPRDLGERVVILEEQLTRVVERDGIGSRGRERLLEARDDELHRALPCRALQPGASADHRDVTAVGMRVRLPLLQTLRSEPPATDGICDAPADADDRSIARADIETAPD
jgi:hypothetical protein